MRAGPHRHPHHHRARQARHRGPLRPQLRARALPRAGGQARPARRRCRTSSELADIHYIRQRDPLGLGHAVSVAREHVGDEPFAVLLGDDIMVDDARAAPLDARRARALRAVGARAHGGDARARSRRTAASSPRRSTTSLVRGAVDRREAGARGGAVEPRGDRPLRVHARDLRRARPHRARARAASSSSPTRSRCCSTDQTGVRPRLRRRPLRHRPEARRRRPAPPGGRRSRPWRRCRPRRSAPRGPTRSPRAAIEAASSVGCRWSSASNVPTCSSAVRLGS